MTLKKFLALKTSTNFMMKKVKKYYFFNFWDFLETQEDETEEGEESAPSKSKNVSLWNTLEPSELAKGFVSASDKRIIFEDRPERFQVLFNWHK